MEFVLPILVLLGLSGLMLGDFGGTSDDEDNGFANDGDRNGDEMDQYDGPLETHFISLTDDDDDADGTTRNDVIRALQGDDTVSGGAGDDRIFLVDGDDTSIDETEGDDLIRGGTGDNIISDNQGADTLFGDIGDDQLSAIDDHDGSDDADSLYGGYGSDVLFVDEGDTASGGTGQDTFHVAFDTSGPPTIITDYAAGEKINLTIPAMHADTDVDMVLHDNGADIQIKLGSQTAIVLQGVTDPDSVNITLTSDFVADGTHAESDFVTGNETANAIDTGGGDDIVFGNDGDDSIYGNFGDDFIDGGLGDDHLRGGSGADTIRDDTGQDSVRGGSGDDLIDLRDTFSDGVDSIAAGDGNDSVFADDGDIVRLGTGADLLLISSEDTTDEPVTVRDFDPADDFLQIAYGDGTGTLSVNADDNFTSVSVNGQIVAILTGVSLNAPVSMDVVPFMAQSA